MLSKKTVASLGVFAILVLLALLAVNVSFTGRGGDTPPNGVTVSGSGDVDSLDSPPPSVDEGEEEAVALDQVAPEDASGDLIATGAEESGAESEREAKAEEESASVAGMVTDEDAFPVADAHVWIDVHGPGHRVVGSFETRTGPDGHYTFSDITLAPPGWSYGGDFGRVSVESKGHVMTRRDIWGLNAGESRTDVDIVLTRASQFVMGIVVSEDGDAVPGAKVELLKYREPGARREKRGEAMFTVTDPKGQFELAIPGTEPVLCALRILKDGHAEGRFLNVETGTENARFALPGFGAIAGRVTNEDGSPSAGTVVGVTSERGYNEPGRTQPPLRAKQMGVTDADGNYRVEELSPHLSYNLGVFDKPENEIQREWWEWMVFGNGELLRMQSEVEDLHVDSGAVLPGIDFELADKYYVRISGHFFDEVSGKPALHTSIGFSFVTSDGDVSRPFFYGDEKGGYDVEFLLNEETTLSDFRLYHSSLIGNWPAGPVRRAEDGQPVQPISVSPGDELTLDLLARGNVNIPVRVVDGSGKAVPGAGVGVGRVHEDGRWQYATINTEQTDENGQCEFTGLPPTFTFFVWADKVPSGAALGSKRTPLAQFGPIQGEEGETVSEVVLVVDVKGGIECILVDAEGNPLNNVPITISAPGLDDGEPQTMHVQTDAIDGHITVLNALLPALYSEITFSATINGTQLQGRLEDVEVVGEGIVDLGVIPLHVVPEDTGGPAPDEASPER